MQTGSTAREAVTPRPANGDEQRAGDNAPGVVDHIGDGNAGRLRRKRKPDLRCELAERASPRHVSSPIR